MTRLLRRPRAGNALFCDRRGDARGGGGGRGGRGVSDRGSGTPRAAFLWAISVAPSPAPAVVIDPGGHSGERRLGIGAPMMAAPVYHIAPRYCRWLGDNGLHNTD
jgi:hypothetical protein